LKISKKEIILQPIISNSLFYISQMNNRKPFKTKKVPPEAKIIGANLKRLRQKAGLTQAIIGKRLDVTFQQIQKYEAGQNRLPMEKLYLLKHLYDVPYEYFFIGLEGFLIKQNYSL
jgi:DNA-binding transcriptional regulator YiaG